MTHRNFEMRSSAVTNSSAGKFGQKSGKMSPGTHCATLFWIHIVRNQDRRDVKRVGVTTE